MDANHATTANMIWREEEQQELELDHMRPAADKASSSPLEKQSEFDVESAVMVDHQLINETVHNISWRGISVTTKGKSKSGGKRLLDGIDGFVEAGEMCAIMGPSGSGKTTLLNVLARRGQASQGVVGGRTLVNGQIPSHSTFRQTTSFAEQDDALIGSLTAEETLYFAARLSHQQQLTAHERILRITHLLDAFGLKQQAKTLVGTPLRAGLSTGQKRRLSVASQLITNPKILFLDEPTSGLDSVASREVMTYVKRVTVEYNLIVIASIHQPSTATFELFDKVLLLSGGHQHYFGYVSDIHGYFDEVGFSMPQHTNPAEFVLDLLNVDFASDRLPAGSRLEQLHQAWMDSVRRTQIRQLIKHHARLPYNKLETMRRTRTFGAVVLALVHRSWIKSYRDVIAYGVRLVMYVGLAIMMGTVWLRLDDDQSAIAPFTNAIFFGSAFMSFMAVAYIPSWLEDLSTFKRERENGMYGSSAFILANFLIGLPYLFIISLIFSLITYWLVDFRHGAQAFFIWTTWLFLDLLAAESLVVLLSSIFPTFVIALALTAFANGLWMCVGGFLVPPALLNSFWRYGFGYIDYQAYVFQGMLVNEFSRRNYNCATITSSSSSSSSPTTSTTTTTSPSISPPSTTCNCMYITDLSPQCLIRGSGVLSAYGIYHARDEQQPGAAGGGSRGSTQSALDDDAIIQAWSRRKTAEWVGILLAIVLVYRVLAVVCLSWRGGWRGGGNRGGREGEGGEKSRSRWIWTRIWRWGWIRRRERFASGRGASGPSQGDAVHAGMRSRDGDGL